MKLKLKTIILVKDYYPSGEDFFFIYMYIVTKNLILVTLKTGGELRVHNLCVNFVSNLGQ
jgi:hypothetical protein